eukprot:9427661-Ditylum_brightwellii.AAC.1
MRSEGINTSPSSNATVNKEPGGKTPPRTETVPMQPSKEVRQRLEDYGPQPHTPPPCQSAPPQKQLRGKVPRKRLQTSCCRLTSKALKEIRLYQNSTALLLLKHPFQQLVCEISEK